MTQDSKESVTNLCNKLATASEHPDEQMQNAALFLLMAPPLEAATQVVPSSQTEGGDLFADIIGALPEGADMVPILPPDVPNSLLVPGQRNPMAVLEESPANNTIMSENWALPEVSPTPDNSKGPVASEIDINLLQHVPVKAIIPSFESGLEPAQASLTQVSMVPAIEENSKAPLNSPADRPEIIRKLQAVPTHIQSHLKTRLPDRSLAQPDKIIQTNQSPPKPVQFTVPASKVEHRVGIANIEEKSVSGLVDNTPDTVQKAARVIPATRQSDGTRTPPDTISQRGFSQNSGAIITERVLGDGVNNGGNELRKPLANSGTLPENTATAAPPNRPVKNQMPGPNKASNPTSPPLQEPATRPLMLSQQDRVITPSLVEKQPLKTPAAGHGHTPIPPRGMAHSSDIPADQNVALPAKNTRAKPVSSIQTAMPDTLVKTKVSVRSEPDIPIPKPVAAIFGPPNASVQTGLGITAAPVEAFKDLPQHRFEKSDRPIRFVRVDAPGKASSTIRREIGDLPATQVIDSVRISEPQFLGNKPAADLGIGWDDAELGLGSPGSAATLETSTSIAPRLAQEPILARHVAVQLADVARTLPGKPMELTLNPEELGRVRLSFAGENGNLTISVTTERPETLDLMRRHIETLAQELRKIGYGQVAFAFGQSGEGERQDHPDQSEKLGRSAAIDPSDNAEEAVSKAASPQPPPNPQSGIDIRL